MKKTKLVVVDEHTLGYILPESPDYLGILHTSILKGSTLNSFSGSVCIKNRNVRLASEKDFDDFRVSFSSAYKNTNNYEYKED
jgi:hypothetical protein